MNKGKRKNVSKPHADNFLLYISPARHREPKVSSTCCIHLAIVDVGSSIQFQRQRAPTYTHSWNLIVRIRLFKHSSEILRFK